jgi:nicotinate phosphoribosyltransferase
MMNLITSDAENGSSALMNDWYQLTMSQGYWKKNLHETESVFHLFFRRLPFKGQWAIAAGLEYVVKLIQNFRFSDSDIAFLGSKKLPNDQPVFEPGFLQYLRDLKFTVTIDAVPEGTVVFSNEPLVRVTGPLLQCQLLETILLNIVNFQTLIATKAARVALAAEGSKVAEFGLRRCQGFGGLEATRASYIGGCHSTSNVLAAKMFNIPTMGTHAHSWVMTFPTELEAFDAWCEVSPENSILLVDTFNVRQGVRNAITVGKKLRAKGQTLKGIRLDSGDLTKLSQEARQMLDEAGFTESVIVASGDLDEYRISALKAEGAKIDLWGVGTNLVTAEDQPALGGVFKLGAVKEGKTWKHRIKFSETSGKTSNPGILDVIRMLDTEGQYVGDIIFDRILRPNPFRITTAIYPHGFNEAMPPGDYNGYERQVGLNVQIKMLLQRYLDQGKQVATLPTIHQIREHAQSELLKLRPELRALTRVEPAKTEAELPYPVGLEKELERKKYEMFQANEQVIWDNLSPEEKAWNLKMD